MRCYWIVKSPLETQAVSIPDDLAIVIVNSNYPRKAC